MAKRKNSRLVSLEEIADYLAQQLSTIAKLLYPYRQEITGFVFFLLTVMVFLNLLGVAPGSVTDTVGNLARNLFGWGAIPVMLCVGVLSVQLMRGILQENPRPVSLEVVIGAELALAAGLAVVHLVAGGNDPLALARAQGGGGFVGWGLGIFLEELIGRWLAAFVYVLVGLAGLGLIFRLKIAEATYWANNLVQSPTVETTQAGGAQPAKARSFRKSKQPQTPQLRPTMSADEAVKAAAATAGQEKVKLPPLDLLAPAVETSGQTANSRYQAQIIEETLRGFGVPVEVIEINHGPTVTQFGLKPGTVTKRTPEGEVIEQRIRVSKISALTNDLALALAAAPIRIETPVPGRPIVGVEVPNGVASLVSLRAAMESEAYRQAKGQLKVSLGKGVAGEVVVADLTALPHVLIAGATGSGKSACINAMIINLLLTQTSDTVKFLLIDPKMVELTAYNGIPHLIAPVVTDFEQVAGALAWVTREMERRYKLLAQTGVRSISGYNHKVGRAEQLPYLVVIIDELADLMLLAADEVERYICRIAQMARATGIHLVIATQRPSVDVVTGLIKANFPARIAFAVTSQIDSRVILDTPGAEKLLGRGDMLYLAPDSPKLARLQGCFVSDPEINNVVEYWKRAVLPSAPKDPLLAAEELPTETKLPWADLVKEANQDNLFEEAVKVVVESGRASTTLLQRRLGIGYPRASRLMDQLEAEGIIGPADGANPREVLWSAEEPARPELEG